MTTDYAIIVEKWKARYRLVHDAFQQKHVNVTRLEIRADELDARCNDLQRKNRELSAQITELAGRVSSLEKTTKKKKAAADEPSN